MRALRLTIKILRGVVGTFLILLGAIYLLLATNAGNLLILHYVQGMMPGISYHQIEGNVASTLKVRQLHYQNDTLKLTIDNLIVKIQLNEFIKTHVTFENILAQGVHIEYHSAVADKTTNHVDLSEIMSYLKHLRLLNVAVEPLDGKINDYPLAGKLYFNYDRAQLNIPLSSINIANAQAMIMGSLAREWNVKWQIQVPTLNKLFPDYHGKVAFSGNIKGKREQPVIHSQVAVEQLQIADYKIGRLHGELRTTALSTSKLTAFFNLYFLADGWIQGHLTLPALTFESGQPITGKLSVHLPRLRQLTTLFPIINGVQGNLTARAELSGQLNQPNIALQANVSRGELPIKPLGITLHNIDLTAAGDDTHPLQFRGSFQSEGQAALTGMLDWNSAGYPLTLHLQGNQLLLANLPEYKIKISPDIDFHYVKDSFKLSGEVNIPFANIKSTKGDNVQTLPNDVIFVHRKAPGLSLLNHVALHLQVTLGNDVYLHDPSIQTQLQGKLRLSKEETADITAIGELYTNNGIYKAYGRELTIRQGRFIYTGNLLTNPGLNIEAMRKFPVINNTADNSSAESSNAAFNSKLSNIIVGIRVRGTFSDPLVTLFSEPGGLAQNDILSYLIFGHPRSQITGASALALLNDVAMDKHSGGKNIKDMTEKMQKKLGLSSLSVGEVGYFNTTTNENDTTTAMTMGKDLGKKLSLHYSLGLFKPISVLNLRYQMLRDVYFQAENSTLENGADVFYEIEF